jgi:hypothetical protein
MRRTSYRIWSENVGEIPVGYDGSGGGEGDRMTTETPGGRVEGNKVELRVESYKGKDGRIIMRFLDQKVERIQFYPAGKSGAKAYGKLNGIL